MIYLLPLLQRVRTSSTMNGDGDDIGALMFRDWQLRTQELWEPLLSSWRSDGSKSSALIAECERGEEMYEDEGGEEIKCIY